MDVDLRLKHTHTKKKRVWGKYGGLVVILGKETHARTRVHTRMHARAHTHTNTPFIA